MLKLTSRVVSRAGPRDRDQYLHDTEIPGFVLKIHPTGIKTYIYRYKNLSGVHRALKLGRHGVLTCAEARRLARNAARAVLEGRDPSGNRLGLITAPTVTDLAKAYLDRCHKRAEIGTLAPNTAERYGENIRNNILPALGHLRVADVTEQDIFRLITRIGRDRPNTADKSLSNLRAMFSYAERSQLISLGSNPAIDVERPRWRKPVRSPEPEEIARLGVVLRQFEQIDRKWWRIVQLIRLLALTGRRLGEIMQGRKEWVDLDARTYRLPNAKGREFLFHIPAPALPVLKAVMEDRPYSHWLFPGKYGHGHMHRPWPRWKVIRKRAALEWMNFHHLRHLHASAACNLGYNLEIVSRILGHSNIHCTQIYAHFYAGSYQGAADNTSAKVAEWLSQDVRTSSRL